MKDLTLLDYFAAKAMQALITSSHMYSTVTDHFTCAEEAYKIAKAMLDRKYDDEQRKWVG